MDRELVVGFDASPTSVDAIDWAAREAVLRGDSLRIVACYDAAVHGESLIGAVEAAAEAVLRMIRRRQPTLQAVADVCAGSAARVLVRESKDSDLLVVGASVHHGVSAFWLGGTARSVARHSSCPVVVVRCRSTTSAPGRIVVGVDGSLAADAAIRWAGDEADRRCVDLVIVHCWSFAYRAVDAASAQARGVEEVDGARLLDRVVEAARDRWGVGVAGMLVEETSTAGLLSAVTEGDVLVVGSTTHGSIVSSLLGSTVNDLLEQSAVPVVVVPSAAA
jgi:nucleotide-binding universal stress UspA family protein